MKKFLSTLFVVLIIVTSAKSQNPEGLRRIHAAKVAYIIDRLHLTAKQSGDFVPLFDDYENEVKGLRQAFYKKYKGDKPEDRDDAATRQFIDDNLDYQQQVIEIKRKYNSLFLKIISPSQLADLYKAEREFRQILMQRLRQQHGGGRRNFRGNGY